MITCHTVSHKHDSFKMNDVLIKKVTSHVYETIYNKSMINNYPYSCGMNYYIGFTVYFT